MVPAPLAPRYYLGRQLSSLRKLVLDATDSDVEFGREGGKTKREGVDLPQDRRPCFYLSSPKEN